MNNEILKKLAEQAGFPEWSQKTIGFELEKFAELIIHECADIAKTAAPYSSDDLILKRFGFDNV